MQGAPKQSDTGLRYFEAISENKRRDVELKKEESKIDDMKKKMLTQYWKDKISVFDEMIRLNVKTPRYERDRTSADQDGYGDIHMTLGASNIDSKLLSNRPVTLQRGTKQDARMDPVISVEGTHAVCYPNKEARKGRRVGLNVRVLRRMEQCKALEDSIASIKDRDRTLDYDNPYSRRRRPKTAPGKIGAVTPRRQKRPATTPGGVDVNVSRDGNSVDDGTNVPGDDSTGTKTSNSPAGLARRPSTSFSRSKREHFLTTPALTDLKSSRSSTSLSLTKDR